MERQVRPFPGYLIQFAGSIPLPSMIALIVPSGRIRPRWYGTITCFAVETLRHFWWLPAEPVSAKP